MGGGEGVLVWIVVEGFGGEGRGEGQGEQEEEEEEDRGGEVGEKERVHGEDGWRSMYSKGLGLLGFWCHDRCGVFCYQYKVNWLQ